MSSRRSTRSADWPKVKSFAERFSRAIAEAEPEMFTANIRKNQRKGRIFLDWLRNQRGATAVMPYSARAREGAPVAAPIAWEELDKVKSGDDLFDPRRRRADRARRLEAARRLGRGQAEAAQGLTWLGRRRRLAMCRCVRLSFRSPSSSSPPRRQPSSRHGAARRRTSPSPATISASPMSTGRPTPMRCSA